MFSSIPSQTGYLLLSDKLLGSFFSLPLPKAPPANDDTLPHLAPIASINQVCYGKVYMANNRGIIISHESQKAER